MGKLPSDIRLLCRMIRTGLLTALRIRTIRRKIMFYVSAGTMITVYLGFTLLDGFLAGNPLIFAVYWLCCAGLVVFMLMLAIYDLTLVKRELNVRAKQELQEVLNDIEETVRANDTVNKDGQAADNTK